MRPLIVAFVGVTAAFFSAAGVAAEEMPIDLVADAPVELPIEGYAARFPPGWGLLRPAGERMRATRAGAKLSLVTFEFHAQWKTPTGRSIASLSPIDLADLVSALQSNERDPLDVRLESLAPATLGGCAGFRAETTWSTTRLRYRRVVYGWAVASGYYTLTYEAPAQHYFAQDLPAFEAVANSVTSGRKRVWKKCATEART